MKTFVVESLQKGSFISPSEIEGITGVIIGTPNYQFALMQLRYEIENELGHLGRPVTVKSEGAGLRILTDSEASIYNERQGNLARFKLFRAFRRNKNVDEANLSDPERQVHYRTLEVQGKYVQALKRVRQELSLEPSKRMTPGL